MRFLRWREDELRRSLRTLAGVRLASSFDLASDDERLQPDLVLSSGGLVKTRDAKPAHELRAWTIVRVELRELSHQIVGDAIGLHAGRDERTAVAETVVAVPVELNEQLVVE